MSGASERLEDEQIIRDIYTARVKQFYASCGYTVKPPEDEPSDTFAVIRPNGIVSIVAMAVGDCDSAIGLVRRRLETYQLYQSKELAAEGCIVLIGETDRDEVARRIRDHGLQPVPFAELSVMDANDLETLVRRQLAALVANTDGAPATGQQRNGAQMRMALASRHIRAFLRSPTRLLVLQCVRRDSLMPHRLARAYAEEFLDDPALSAPLWLPLADESSRELEHCAGQMFRYHDVRFSGRKLRALLDGGGILPIFHLAEGVLRPGHPLDIVRQALGAEGQAVLVMSGSAPPDVDQVCACVDLPPGAVGIVTIDDPESVSLLRLVKRRSTSPSRRSPPATAKPPCQVPLNALVLSSPEDDTFRAALYEHLSPLLRQRIIQPWHIGEIVPGADQLATIAARIDAADLILLLVSASLLGWATYVQYLERIRTRQHRGDACIIPIMVRPCGAASEWFAELKPLPANAKPVAIWGNQDEAWMGIVGGIRTAAEEILSLGRGPNR